MLTAIELAALERELRDERILSVYLDGTAEDFAAQRAWRVALGHSLKDLRAWLAGSSHDEREGFERCVGQLERQLARFTPNVGAPGWVAFIAPDHVRYAERVPVPMPTLAVWSTGPCVAPYIRALKQERPVIVALVDARKAMLYRYQAGALERVQTLHAQATVEPPSHMGDAPRAGFHHGVHGPTGHDEAQRSLLEGTARLLRSVAEQVMRLAGADGWIVVGGIPRVGVQLERALGAPVATRLMRLDWLDVHASDADVTDAAQRAASALRDTATLRRLRELADSGRGNGLAALGPSAVQRALAQGRVRELYLTRRYLEEHTPEAEDAVRSALDQHAAVEQAERDPAKWLDEYGGMAALLRYSLPETGEATTDVGAATG